MVLFLKGIFSSSLQENPILATTRWNKFSEEKNEITSRANASQHRLEGWMRILATTHTRQTSKQTLGTPVIMQLPFYHNPLCTKSQLPSICSSPLL